MVQVAAGHRQPTQETVVNEQQMPPRVLDIRKRGYVVWADGGPPPALRAKFSREPVEVGGIRHVRVWGLQVDDERELHGHERTSVPDEELWQVDLLADDGSHYEVNATFVEPAPD